MDKPQSPWPLAVHHQQPEVHFAEMPLNFRTAPMAELEIEKAAQEKLAALLDQIRAEGKSR